MTVPEVSALSTELTSSSLVELAVERLRREILGGAFQPGDRIVEEQVTKRFGISRGPLREALRLLAQQGILEHLPRRGVRVATLSDGAAAELFELRDVLERHAVAKALPFSPLGLQSVAAELELMRSAAMAGDALRHADAHRNFHVALVGLAGQHQLMLTYEPIIVRLQLHMATNLRREAEIAQPFDGVRRHQELLDTLADADPDVVLSALSDHGQQRYLH